MNTRYALIIILILVSLIFVSLNISAQSAQNLNNTFLMAVYEKDYTLMEKLLKNGADINAPDKEGSVTPLAVAAGNGDLELVNFLIKKGANPHGNQDIPNLPLYLAISNNHVKVVEKFLDLGISQNYAWPNRNGGTLLITAVQMGNLETVKLLVHAGADVNFCGNGDYSPLYRSIIYDHFVTFEFLINSGAFLNKDDLSALSELEWWNNDDKNKYIKLLGKTTP